MFSGRAVLKIDTMTHVGGGNIHCSLTDLTESSINVFVLPYACVLQIPASFAMLNALPLFAVTLCTLQLQQCQLTSKTAAQSECPFMAEGKFSSN